MLVKTINPWREKIISKLLGLVYHLDNTGDSNLNKNGEKKFVESFIESTGNRSLTVFDVGANVGDYSQMLIEKFDNRKNYSLHLFEPQKNCFLELQNKFNNNEKVAINNFGLSNHGGISTIYKDKDKSGLSSLYNRNLEFYNLKMDKEEQIELKKASQYIEEKDIKHIDLLKIDIEGHEINALEGFGRYLNSDFIDYIQFEYGGANMNSHTNLQDFYNLLLPKGYLIAKIMPTYLEIRDYNPRLDNFVYQNNISNLNQSKK